MNTDLVDKLKKMRDLVDKARGRRVGIIEARQYISARILEYETNHPTVDSTTLELRMVLAVAYSLSSLETLRSFLSQRIADLEAQ